MFLTVKQRIKKSYKNSLYREKLQLSKQFVREEQNSSFEEHLYSLHAVTSSINAHKIIHNYFMHFCKNVSTFYAWKDT